MLKRMVILGIAGVLVGCVGQTEEPVDEAQLGEAAAACTTSNKTVSAQSDAKAENETKAENEAKNEAKQDQHVNVNVICGVTCEEEEEEEAEVKSKSKDKSKDKDKDKDKEENGYDPDSTEDFEPPPPIPPMSGVGCVGLTGCGAEGFAGGCGCGVAAPITGFAGGCGCNPYVGWPSAYRAFPRIVVGPTLYSYPCGLRHGLCY